MLRGSDILTTAALPQGGNIRIKSMSVGSSTAVDFDCRSRRGHLLRSAIHLALVIFLASAAAVQPQVVESGFGTSSLLHLDPDGRSGQVYSERVFDGRRGLEKIYALEAPQGKGYAYIAEHADVDGDGMDDVALVWGERGLAGTYFDSVLRIYDGFSGEEQFSYSFSGPSRGTAVLAVTIADFDGDGREEFVFALADRTISEEVAFTYLDSYEGTIREGFLPEILGTASLSSLQLCSGDFNGDNSDDAGIAYVEAEFQSAQVVIKAFDVRKGRQIFSARLPAVPAQRPGSVQLKSADVHGGGRSSLAVLVASENLQSKASLSRLYLIDADGNADLAFDTVGDAAFEITSLTFADLSGDGSEDAVVITSLRHDKGVHSAVTAIDVSNGDQRLLYSTPSLMGQTSEIYIGLGVDLDGDGLDEVVVVENSPSPGAEQEASKLTVIGAGGEIVSEYSGGVGSTDPTRILEVFPGDFDNDARTDLLIVHGASAHALPQDAAGTAVLLNHRGVVSNRRVLSTDSGGRFVPFANEISDAELLRAINMNTRLHDLSRLRSLFTEGRTSLAITELFRLFKERGGIDGINIDVEDWYYGNGTDILVSNIRRISTAAAMEHPCFGCNDNVYGSFTAAGRRTGRILSTLLHRLNTGDRLDERDFVMALKALYAQMIWKSREGHATIANNHGTLFELDSYLPASIALSMFKAYDAPNLESWLDVIDERLRYQIDHVFDDGVHDEHSFYYAYRMSSSFNKFLALLEKNRETIRLKSWRMSGLRNAVLRLNEYMIYAVKPIEPKLDDEKVYTASDIPVIGDTKGLWVRSFGKQPVSDYFDSFLSEPIRLGHTEYWDDAELANTLSFVADPRGKRLDTFDLAATKYFAHSGIFISRSNWLAPDGAFDHDARYAYFRGGELIPRPGPFWGYSTWSHHAHADLLSVELSGYNDNLIVESGGLLFPGHRDIIEGFDRQRYRELYGYISNFDDFLTARHYFKGTAAHSTVYVNKRDQATFMNHFRWSGYGQLMALETHHIIADELDYYSAAIDNGDYTHRRDMYYVKPHVDDQLSDDYWLFVDRVDIQDRSTDNRVEQIWHVSPSQRLRVVDLEMASVETENMVVVHAKSLDAPPLQVEVVDTYNLTDFLRIDSKAIKFLYDQTAETEFTLATVILPFGAEESVADVRLEEIEIRGANGLVDLHGARAFKLRFSRTGAQGRRHEVEDNIFISNVPHGVYSWSPGRRGTTTGVMTNRRFEIHRRVDGEHAKTMAVDWKGIPDFDIETVAGEYSETVPRTTTLEQNYPNPFNGNTAIRFTVAERGAVDLSLYSTTGQKVSSLVNGLYEPGTFTVRWRGRDDRGRAMASGVYLYRLRAGNRTETKRLLLIR